jgi:hypothetical protein
MANSYFTAEVSALYMANIENCLALLVLATRKSWPAQLDDRLFA